MQESFDLSHRETQTLLPGPLDEVSSWNKVGTLTLPANALSIASAVVFGMTLLYLRHSREMRSLFVLPLGWGMAVALLSALLAWIVVVRCSRRPGLSGPRVWALFLAILNSVFALLLFAWPKATWINALMVAGFAAALTLLPRLYKLRPDSGMIPRIAPLAFLGVLLLVLPAVGWTGGSIAASKRIRVDRTIEQLREWTSEVAAMAGRDWSGASWDDSAKAVDRLAEIQPAAQLDLSLWREATTLGRDGELAAEAGKLLEATVAGLARERVPRVSRLNEPAAYNDGTRWETSPVFPQASATIGRYFEEMGRIFAELDVQDSLPESQGLTELKQRYLEAKSKLVAELDAQMDEWTDHWAVFRIPSREDLLGQSNVPLGKLLRNPSPIQGKPAADLPGLLKLSYGRVHSRQLPGCRPLEPFTETRSDGEHEFYRIDCYAYAPRVEGAGADLRVEMRLVYRSAANHKLRWDERPAEVYFLFPLPDGQKEEEFQKQVMSDLAEAVRETTGLQAGADNRTNASVNGFRVRGAGYRIVVRKPRFQTWVDDRKGLEVRAERER